MKPIEIGEKYNKIARWWTLAQMENPEYGMAYIRKAINHTSKKGKFLEIGCGGTGRVIKEAVDNGFAVTAIDASSEMIQLTRKKYPNINLVNVEFLDWEISERFDLIIAWDSTFHASIQFQPKITQKICEMLYANGVLLFTCGAYEGEAHGEMEGVPFSYGSIGYRKYIDILEDLNCRIILLEEDQFPSGHFVVMAQKQ